MKVSETTQKIYEGVSGILKEHGQALTKAQVYAIESMVETMEEAVEKRCLSVTEDILAKKDALMKKEILTFEGDDERPVIFDPLFEYWLKNKKNKNQ